MIKNLSIAIPKKNFLSLLPRSYLKEDRQDWQMSWHGMRLVIDRNPNFEFRPKPIPKPKLWPKLWPKPKLREPFQKMIIRLFSTKNLIQWVL